VLRLQVSTPSPTEFETSMISSMVDPWGSAANIAADARGVAARAGGVNGDGHELDQLGGQDTAVHIGAHGPELLEPPRPSS
jgi:hypothetical protein